MARHLSGIDLTEYADGETSGARLAWVQQHLSRCQACAAALAQIRETVGALQAVVIPAPPRDLPQQVATRLSAEPLPAVSCREAGRLVHESLDAALPPLEAGLLRLHVDACARCREEFASLRDTTARVRSLPSVPAPAGIWEAVRAGQRTRPVPVPWGVRLRPAMAAAAMAAGALLTLHYAPHAVPPQTALVKPAPAPERIATAAELTAPQPQPAPAVRPEANRAVSPTTRAARESRPRTPMAVAMLTGARPAAPQQGQIVFARARKSPLSPEPMLTLAKEGTGSGVPKIAAASVTGHIPNALQVLRTVARAVSSDQVAQVQMARAGERYDILVSEDKAAAGGLPKAAPGRSPERSTEAAPARPAPRDPGASEGQGRPAPGRAATPQDPTVTT